jgi:hypothetical protein
MGKHLENWKRSGRITLSWSLGRWVARMVDGWNWPRIVSNDELCCYRVLELGVLLPQCSLLRLAAKSRATVSNHNVVRRVWHWYVFRPLHSEWLGTPDRSCLLLLPVGRCCHTSLTCTSIAPLHNRISRVNCHEHSINPHGHAVTTGDTSHGHSLRVHGGYRSKIIYLKISITCRFHPTD